MEKMNNTKKVVDFLTMTIVVLFSLTVSSQTETLTFGCYGEHAFDKDMFFIDSDLAVEIEAGGKCEAGDVIGPLEVIEIYGGSTYSYFYYPFTVTYIPTISGDILLDVELELEYTLETASFSNNGLQLFLENGENQSYPLSRDGFIWKLTDEFPSDVRIKNPKIVMKSIGDVNYANLKIFRLKFEGTRLALNQETNNISNEELESSFHLFSFEHTLNVETNLNEDYKLDVYNLTGQLIYSKVTKGHFKTNLPENGFYIVKLRFKNKMLTKRVLIQ